MPGGAYINAIFEAGGDGKSASGPLIPLEPESGCAGCDTPDDSPGGGSMISGCAGYELPSGRPGGGSVTSAPPVVATGLGPLVGPTMGPGVVPGVGPEVGTEILTPDVLWSVPQVSCDGC